MLLRPNTRRLSKVRREYGADISIREFFQLYWDRGQGAKIKTPKAMDVAFAELEGVDGQRIRELVAAYDAAQATKLEQGAVQAAPAPYRRRAHPADQDHEGRDGK